MKTITLLRKNYWKNSTLSVFKEYPNIFIGELPNLNNQNGISCIPEGQYLVLPHITSKFPFPGVYRLWEVVPQTFQLKAAKQFIVDNGIEIYYDDPKPRVGILIHSGNYINYKINPADSPISDVEGCLLPGLSYSSPANNGLFISQSKVALDQLRTEFNKLGQFFYLNITSKDMGGAGIPPTPNSNNKNISSNNNSEILKFIDDSIIMLNKWRDTLS